MHIISPTDKPSVPLLSLSRPASQGSRDENVPMSAPKTAKTTLTARRSAVHRELAEESLRAIAVRQDPRFHWISFRDLPNTRRLGLHAS
jgi:hypothetical protein